MEAALSSFPGSIAGAFEGQTLIFKVGDRFGEKVAVKRHGKALTR